MAWITGDLTASGVERSATIEVVSDRTGLPISVANNLAHPYYWDPFILITRRIALIARGQHPVVVGSDGSVQGGIVRSPKIDRG